MTLDHRPLASPSQNNPNSAASAMIRPFRPAAPNEIDLSAKNARGFRTKLAPFIEHARRASRGRARWTPRTSAGRQRSGEVRAWAKDDGLAVRERGRIPASVIEQYQPPPKDAEQGRGRRLPRARITYPITGRERMRYPPSRVPPNIRSAESA